MKFLVGLSIIFLFIVSILSLSGCQNITCNKPYILVGQECCLDADDNKICDKDEIKTQTQTPTQCPVCQVCEATKITSRQDCPPTQIPTERFKDYLVYLSDNADAKTVNDSMDLSNMFHFQILELESEASSQIDPNTIICMARKK